MRSLRTMGTLLALLLVLPAITQARPLPVKLDGPQTVVMRPNCESSEACAQVGDYVLTLVVDLAQPALGVANLTVGVTKASGAAVDDCAVLVRLTMPEHRDALPPLTTRHLGNGKYAATARGVKVRGTWHAEVAMTTLKGDTIKQRYTFRPDPNWVITRGRAKAGVAHRHGRATDTP